MLKLLLSSILRTFIKIYHPVRVVIFYFFTIAFRTVETLLNCIDSRYARSARIFNGSLLCVNDPKKSGTRQSNTNAYIQFKLTLS